MHNNILNNLFLRSVIYILLTASLWSFALIKYIEIFQEYLVSKLAVYLANTLHLKNIESILGIIFFISASVLLIILHIIDNSKYPKKLPVRLSVIAGSILILLCLQVVLTLAISCSVFHDCP